jgi:hypothetical protein
LVVERGAQCLTRRTVLIVGTASIAEINTAPGFSNRADLESALAAQKAAGIEADIEQEINERSEVYTVRDAVWKAAGMEPYGGCLCIGCLEKRLGRKLRPKDFLRGDAFNDPRLPGTPRLLNRRSR